MRSASPSQSSSCVGSPETEHAAAAVQLRRSRRRLDHVAGAPMNSAKRAAAAGSSLVRRGGNQRRADLRAAVDHTAGAEAAADEPATVASPPAPAERRSASSCAISCDGSSTGCNGSPVTLDLTRHVELVKPRPRRQPSSPAGSLRQHEADVLAQDLELRDVRRPARAEEVHEAARRAPRARWRRRRCRRRGRPRATPPAPGRRCRSGTTSAPWSRATSTSRLEFDEFVRADHEHEVALRGHLLDRRLAVRGRVTDVVGARPGDVREALAQAGDDRARLVDRQRGLGDVGELALGSSTSSVSTSASVSTSTMWSGASPIVPSTSSWPAWPISTIV